MEGPKLTQALLTGNVLQLQETPTLELSILLLSLREKKRKTNKQKKRLYLHHIWGYMLL